MSKDSYLVLYNSAKGAKPYQPTATWCANSRYQPNELLHPKIKSKFIPDDTLVNKREFIRDNFYLASPEGLEPPRTVLETDMLPLHQRDILGGSGEIRTHGTH